jgi:hypothetical protein
MFQRGTVLDTIFYKHQQERYDAIASTQFIYFLRNIHNGYCI